MSLQRYRIGTPGALAAMREIYNAEDVDKAQLAIKAFEIDYGAKYPKAVAKIVDDVDVLLEFYQYPAEHWIHLRTTTDRKHLRHSSFENESHQRARLTSRWLAMAYKLIEAAQTRCEPSTRHTCRPVRAARCSTKQLLNDPSTSRPPNPANQPQRRSPETTPSTVYLLSRLTL